MNEFKTTLSGDIKIGDYIVVADGNYLNTGFYIGRGQGNSFQFFTVRGLVVWLDTKLNNPTYKRKHPYRSYLNTPSSYRISKYSPDCLTSEEKQEYEKALEALKLLNLR